MTQLWEVGLTHASHILNCTRHHIYLYVTEKKVEEQPELNFHPVKTDLSNYASICLKVVEVDRIFQPFILHFPLVFHIANNFWILAAGVKIKSRFPWQKITNSFVLVLKKDKIKKPLGIFFVGWRIGQKNIAIIASMSPSKNVMQVHYSSISPPQGKHVHMISQI